MGTHAEDATAVLAVPVQVSIVVPENVSLNTALDAQQTVTFTALHSRQVFARFDDPFSDERHANFHLRTFGPCFGQD